jgi:hypothetical protein
MILCSPTIVIRWGTAARQPVLRIHDILGWIRILLFSSLPFKDGSKKLILLSQFFLLITFEATFTSLFKDKKSKGVTK